MRVLRDGAKEIEPRAVEATRMMVCFSVVLWFRGAPFASIVALSARESCAKMNMLPPLAVAAGQSVCRPWQVGSGGKQVLNGDEARADFNTSTVFPCQLDPKVHLYYLCVLPSC